MNNSFTFVLSVILLLLILSFVEIPKQSEVTSVSIIVLDSISQKETPCRIKITKAGKPIRVVPNEAIGIMYGMWDHADQFAVQPDSSFYIAGHFKVELPPGTYEFTVSKGLEYIDQTFSLAVASTGISKKITLKRWINMNDRGWFSADAHIHIRRSPREDSLLLQWLEAEKI
jgi:hypothetical protein